MPRSSKDSQITFHFPPKAKDVSNKSAVLMISLGVDPAYDDKHRISKLLEAIIEKGFARLTLLILDGDARFSSLKAQFPDKQENVLRLEAFDAGRRWVEQKIDGSSLKEKLDIVYCSDIQNQEYFSVVKNRLQSEYNAAAVEKFNVGEGHVKKKKNFFDGVLQMVKAYPRQGAFASQAQSELGYDARVLESWSRYVLLSLTALAAFSLENGTSYFLSREKQPLAVVMIKEFFRFNENPVSSMDFPHWVLIHGFAKKEMLQGSAQEASLSCRGAPSIFSSFNKLPNDSSSTSDSDQDLRCMYNQVLDATQQQLRKALDDIESAPRDIAERADFSLTHPNLSCYATRGCCFLLSMFMLGVLSIAVLVGVKIGQDAALRVCRAPSIASRPGA